MRSLWSVLWVWISKPLSLLWYIIDLKSLSSAVRYCVCVCMWAQSCPTLCDPMDCNLPSSSVPGIFQARILEWVAISYSKGSSWLRDWVHISCISLSSHLHWQADSLPLYHLGSLPSLFCYILSALRRMIVATILQPSKMMRAVGNCFGGQSAYWDSLMWKVEIRGRDRNPDSHERCRQRDIFYSPNPRISWRGIPRSLKTFLSN